MTPAERFVVVAGVSLLVLNFILFGFCLALVYDSRATRNDTAHLIVLTNRLLENQQTTPKVLLTNIDATSKPKQLEVTASSQESKGSEGGCPLLLRSTQPTTTSEEVTGVELSTETTTEEDDVSDELIDENPKVKTTEERIAELEETVRELLKSRNTTPPPTRLRRRRNGEGLSS